MHGAGAQTSEAKHAHPTTAQEFIAKWKPVALTERAAAHSHFLDLCALLAHDDPVKADPTGEWFTFEKGVTKTGGGEGFADVWKKGFFAWEYKKKKHDLNAAMNQLVRYAAALENPPLQVACDTDRFLIRTAWTNTVPKEYEIKLDELADPKKLDILRSVFFDPDKLKPGETRASLTTSAADKFSDIAARLAGTASDEDVAHFINQLVFCFFANSIKLLPEKLLPRLLDRCAQKPERSQELFDKLFAAMQSGGEFDLTDITWFNGGLFDGRKALPLDGEGIKLLHDAAELDWSQIDPSIFGSLFERFLDPEKRAQVGTHNTGVHYTDAVKIMMIVEPVILRPLREEWAKAKAEIEGLLHGEIKPPMRAKVRRRMTPLEAAEEVRSRYLERLRKLSILDPACGSGNFLYLSLQAVKDLENLVNLECEALGLAPRALMVGPEIVHGIEINPMAAELARTTIWIGDIQWRRRNGIIAEHPPILRKLESIECRDALLKKDEQGNYKEIGWPAAEFIVGNPPFLGVKKMRSGLGDEYTDVLRKVYEGRVDEFSDLVCWWFEKARQQIVSGSAKRAGLVATNSITGGQNRLTLDRIAKDLRIFEAWSDEPWVVDGAAVRVSLVCFESPGYQDPLKLDGKPVSTINPDLTCDANVASARRLKENAGVSFIGMQKSGPHDIEGQEARKLLALPQNTNLRSNAEVLRPYINGLDIVRRPRDMWIVDFDGMDGKQAALYEGPFEHLKQLVEKYVEDQKQKLRDRGRDDLAEKYQYREDWWRLWRPRPELKAAIKGKEKVIVTAEVAKHRVFVWMDTRVRADKNVTVIARDDYVTFGILQSRFHIAWSLRLGTSLEDRPRYTPTTTFETFPFPDGLTPDLPAAAVSAHPKAEGIISAAKKLDENRSKWLNPANLVEVTPDIVPVNCVPREDGRSEFPDRVVAKSAAAARELKGRTLTALYNQRPQWLLDAHEELDKVVAAAYGWTADISDDEALASLLQMNLARQASGAPLDEEPENQDD